jgi:acetolactate synthase-1/2/3 large subunit
MKLSDYVAQFLAKQGIKYVFAITGGAAVHLIDSIAKTPGITYICPQHEQAGAMAADAYARVTENLGVAISTSGPGATNMITGICCSYYDSVPTLYITGQVASFRLKRDMGIRQNGFQETDIVDMVKPITKYAVLVSDPENIRFELEKAVFIAKSGRPGPVLVDICDDIQRYDIDPNNIRKFLPNPPEPKEGHFYESIDACVKLLNESKRPILLFGWGVHLSHARNEAKQLADLLNIPVTMTWGLKDLLPGDYPWLVASFGTHGTRYGNFAIQNSDLILAIGSRLDTHLTGTPFSTFARDAKKIIVDIDRHELNKFYQLNGLIDVPVLSDAKTFIRELLLRHEEITMKNISAWKIWLEQCRTRFPITNVKTMFHFGVDPYRFVETLSDKTSVGDIIVVDSGCTVAWMLQAFKCKKDQRIISAFNNTPMGYALPAAIGASFASNCRQVICVTGDGGLQMNIQELITVLRHNLPVKIFLLNNHGYGMVQQTQEQWLNSRYEATTIEGGLGFPDFVKVAKAFGFEVINIVDNNELSQSIQKSLSINGPVFCNVEIPPEARVIPQVKFGRPIEDSEPLLSRKEFSDNMIVQPMDVSLH